MDYKTNNKIDFLFNLLNMTTDEKTRNRILSIMVDTVKN